MLARSLLVQPVVTFVGVQDFKVQSPRGRASKTYITAADERPPPK